MNNAKLLNSQAQYFSHERIDDTNDIGEKSNSQTTDDLKHFKAADNVEKDMERENDHSFTIDKMEETAAENIEENASLESNLCPPDPSTVTDPSLKVGLKALEKAA